MRYNQSTPSMQSNLTVQSPPMLSSTQQTLPYFALKKMLPLIPLIKAVLIPLINALPISLINTR
jgi:hypothetical protein